MRDSYPIPWKALYLWALIESDKEQLTGLIPSYRASDCQPRS